MSWPERDQAERPSPHGWLTREWRTTSTIARSCGLSSKGARSRLERLQRHGLVDHMTRGDGTALWRLPAETVSRLTGGQR
jgi:predicted ArsR family transcriptional regulator